MEGGVGRSELRMDGLVLGRISRLFCREIEACRSRMCVCVFVTVMYDMRLFGICISELLVSVNSGRVMS